MIVQADMKVLVAAEDLAIAEAIWDTHSLDKTCNILSVTGTGTEE